MPGFELIGKEEKKACDSVFDNGGVLYRYGLDAKRKNIFKVDEFEKAVAERVGAKYCHCVCNGTAALKIGLFALGVRAGDEVIAQSFTFIATVEAILELGAKPVIAEVDDTLNMDPEDLRKKITDKTRVIIPVHMAGVAAKMDEIISVAKKFNIPVFEDSAQAFGASYKGRNLGTIGKAGIYSFDIGKVVTAGEGGALVTDDRNLYLRAREYSDHGHEYNPAVPRGKDTRSSWGFNYKMMELQGAIGLAQLGKLDYILNKQKEHKARIKEGIKGIENIEFRNLPDAEGDASDTLIFFVETRGEAEKFAKGLADKGLGTKNLPDALDWHFAGTWNHIYDNYTEYKDKDLEKVWAQSTSFLRRAIAIPIMVNMSDEQIDKVIIGIKEVAQRVLADKGRIK